MCKNKLIIKLKKITFLLILGVLLVPIIYATQNYGEGGYGSGAYGQAVCGDSVCDSSESCSTCIADCGVCPVDDSSEGGAATPSEGEPTLTKTSLLVNVNPGEETTVTSFNGTGIKEITIIINQPTQNIRIQVLKYDSKPANVSKNISEKTYKYLQINTENLEGNLEKAKVKFEVNKSWLAENSLDKEDMVVLKFDETSEKWNELDTLYDSEDESYHYYVVELNSFSYFAIGEKAKIPIVSAITDSYEKASQTKLGLIIWWSIFVILIIGVIIIITLIITELKKERFGGSILN